MADDNQRQDYEKKGGSMSGAKGGSNTGSGSSGPTGSSRSYPKGKGGGHMRTDWNPQKVKASTYGICGV
jgi:hypothetical protein